MEKTILIIDDDKELNRLLTSYLAQFGLKVLSSTESEQGLQVLKEQGPALIVLDVMLPGMNGFETCREIRKLSKVPIIMLTARGELSDRIVGLELGADDYLPKPFEPRELVARIQSVLRRTDGHLVSNRQIFRSQDLIVDFEKATAVLAGEDLQLTSAEFSALWHLMENAGKTISREEIFKHLRGVSWDGLDRSVDMLMSRMRSKLKDSSKQPRYLKTMWGEGYRFVGDVRRE
jgi:DNA-binding response OmpR family regulator